MKKLCTKCRVEQDISQFTIKRANKDGLQNNCRSCLNVFHKEHYNKRKQYYKDKAARHAEEYRLRNLQFIIDFLKEHPCVDCGESDPIVLDFDHRNPEEKEYQVSSLIKGSFDTLKNEIAKCDIRCANCHRRRTAIQLNWYKNIKI